MRRRRLWLAPLLVPLSSFCPSASAEKDWSGTYVMYQEATSVTELPVVNDVVASVRTTALVELRQHGDRLRGTGKICKMQMVSSSSMVKTIFPPAFRRAVPPLVVDAKLKRKGRELRFTQAPQTVVLGARLKDKAKDSLPRDKKDKRVFDHDRDGKPGVTVAVSGFVSGEVYLVQRSTSRLSGKQKGSGFRGQLQFKNDQRVLGASSSLLNRETGAKPDLKRSFFRMDQVAGDLSCGAATRLTKTW